MHNLPRRTSTILLGITRLPRSMGQWRKMGTSLRTRTGRIPQRSYPTRREGGASSSGKAGICGMGRTTGHTLLYCAGGPSRVEGGAYGVGNCDGGGYAVVGCVGGWVASAEGFGTERTCCDEFRGAHAF